MVGQDTLVQVDALSMSVVNIQQFDYTLTSGFATVNGDLLVYFIDDTKAPSFITINPSTLQTVNTYAFPAPSGAIWAAYPYCHPSNNNQSIAYCSCELESKAGAILYTFTLSLSTFTMINYIEGSGDFVVSAPVANADADLFVVSDYEVGKVVYYNLTAYDDTLAQIWQIELPSNTDIVYAIESIGTTIVLSIVLTRSEQNVLNQYESVTGDLLYQWNNTLPCDIIFDSSYPTPFVLIGSAWNIFAFGIPTDSAGEVLTKLVYEN